MTFLAALHYDRTDALSVIGQPINGDSFQDYVELCVIPTHSAGDAETMDNLSRRMRPASHRFIRGVAARLELLSRHSPDLNLIEQVFAKYK